MHLKNFKKIISTVCAAAMAASVVGYTGINIKSDAATPDSYHDDWLHTDGNQVVDMNGNPVWITGCNWFGYNVGSQVFDGVWSQNMHDMLRQIADHGFNFLRVPMSAEILLQWKNGDPDPSTPKINTYSNPELAKNGKEGGDPMYSFDVWNLAVKWCRELGLKIMIDIHSAETNSAGHQVNVWYTDKISAEQWQESLEWVADYYKDDDTILALDLKNEPHGKAGEGTIAKWDNSTDANNWKYAAEKCANAVLKINPNLLIMIEGTEVYPKEEYDWSYPNIDYSRYPFSYYYGTWWGGNFRGEKDYPIKLENNDYQDQVVFSPHDYGPLVYKQTWFDKDFTTDTLMNDVWKDNWYFIYEQKIAPLLIGEWGGFIDSEHDTDGKNKEWMTDLRDLMIKDHINHTFWCFNENSGDTGGLVYDNFGKWDEDKYALVKPALWQNDDGKFISLDHSTALGANGISLADYYGTTPTPKPTNPSGEESSETVPDIIAGDLNSDKKVNAIDLTIMRKKLIDAASNYDKTAENTTRPEDCNADGYFTSSDLVLLSKFILKENDAKLKLYK